VPTVTDHPSAEGSVSNWGLAAGASKVAAVATNDGDTSYIFKTGVPAVAQRFLFPAVPDDAESPLVQATIEAQARRGTDDVTFYLDWDSASDGGRAILMTYALYTRTISAPTKAAANREHGVTHAGPFSTSESKVTELYRTIDVVFANKAFILIMDLLAPLIGVGLTLAQMPALAREIDRWRPAGGVWRRFALRPDELPIAWEAWRAPRPRYVLL